MECCPRHTLAPGSALSCEWLEWESTFLQGGVLLSSLRPGSCLGGEQHGLCCGADRCLAVSLALPLPRPWGKWRSGISFCTLTDKGTEKLGNGFTQQERANQDGAGALSPGSRGFSCDPVLVRCSHFT